MDLLRGSRIATSLLAAGLLAGCGGHARGTLGADDVKLSFGVPANVGQVLTLTEVAMSYRGRGIAIESIQPLEMRGNARYLGTALLLPPRQGFGMDLSARFPHIVGNPRFTRLPYTTTRQRGSINLGLGFALRGPGVTTFAGVAVRYRQHGRAYVATVPLAARICVPFRRWAGRCASPAPAAIPEASIRPA